MGGRSGCFDVIGFFIMVVAIIAVFALIVGAVGSSPVIDSTGLHWDDSARINHDNIGRPPLVGDRGLYRYRPVTLDVYTWRKIGHEPGLS